MNQSPRVSVILPVYNDAERLKLCLEALEAQSYPSDGYEVIVVDNGSDKSPDLVVALFPHATLAFQPKAGSYAARNMGLSVANGQFLAFTDADCIATPQWLRCGVNRMLELNGKGLVAGYIRLFYKKPKRPGWVELCDLATAFEHCLPLVRSPATNLQGDWVLTPASWVGSRIQNVKSQTTPKPQIQD